MRIGIPRALLYFRYKVLWQEFFERLGHNIVLSPPTDKKIFDRGCNLSIDEACLPAKIFLGAVESLAPLCDYILCPRWESFGKNEMVCVKFNALPDLARLVCDTRLLVYDVDVLNKKTEQAGLFAIGRRLGASACKVTKAYKEALAAHEHAKLEAHKEQEKLLLVDKTKVLVVGHPYNVYDNMIGQPILRAIEALGGVAIMAHELDKGHDTKLCKSLYWTFSKELFASLEYAKDFVDGIVFLTAFPCGPDSLANDLVVRKLQDVPKVCLVLDELCEQTGVMTRLESFFDILDFRKKQRSKSEGFVCAFS